MAMGKCRGCKNQVYSEVKECPNCGMPNPYKKANKYLHYGFLAVLTYFIFKFANVAYDNSAPPAPPPKPLTAEELRIEKIESQFNQFTGSHRLLEGAIKKILNDPDSYQHDETRYLDNKDHILVTTRYRAKNGFGALVLNSITAKFDIQGNLIEVIEK